MTGLRSTPGLATCDTDPCVDHMSCRHMPASSASSGFWDNLSTDQSPSLRTTTYIPQMSFLRRRFGGAAGTDSPSDLSREPSPTPDDKRPSNLRVVTAERLQTLTKGKHGKRKNLWVFGLGGIFGLLVAAFFATSSDMIDLKSLENVNLESLMEALPANFVRSAQQLQVKDKPL